MRIWASHEQADDTVSFHVRDTEIGVARDDVELIFQEFGQVANRLQGRVKGTGLGLPLAKKLAELLGGRITVDSEPGKGSTFSVVVPRVHDTAKSIETARDWSLIPRKNSPAAGGG